MRFRLLGLYGWFVACSSGAGHEPTSPAEVGPDAGLDGALFDEVATTTTESGDALVDPAPDSADDVAVADVADLADGTDTPDATVGTDAADAPDEVRDASDGTACGACGPHATCDRATERCVCGPGFAGDGEVCEEVTLPVPPDPATLASSVSQSEIASLAATTAFLYEGPDAIQTGVAAGAIASSRAAVIRGVVRDRDGDPLPGVRVSVVAHDELGATATRSDGQYDMAVNGGGTLTLSYRIPGHLEAHRHVPVGWHEFAQAPDVVLVALDPTVTAIDTSGDGPSAVVAGPLVSDADGARRATVVFAAGTSASLRLPDGASQAAPTLSVRLTEYTVGAAGPASLPGPLPATSGYTYAVEISADEALAWGATQVELSQPAALHVDNFLHFPVGVRVPVGFYDRTRAAWVPSDDGVVIGVLAVVAGHATIDSDGDGAAEDDATLAALGIDDDERAILAQRYLPGASLWRARLSHLTPYDCNWPYGPPADARPPRVPRPRPLCAGNTGQPSDKGCGSIISIQGQSLGERIPLVGTPHALYYESARVSGISAIRVPATDADLPASLQRIEVAVSVAGRYFTRSLEPTPDQEVVITWDGRDAYGRLVAGTHRARVELTYVYRAAYFGTQFALNSERTFALARPAEGVAIGVPRQDLTFALTQTTEVDVAVTRALGGDALGGWNIDVHHAYDPVARALYLGTGDVRRATHLDPVIEAATRTGPHTDSCHEGERARDVSIGNTLAGVGPDGSVYLLHGHLVCRIDPEGVLHWVAGGGTTWLVDDGVTTVDAIAFGGLYDGVAAPDGNLYVSASARFPGVPPTFLGVIYRIAPDGQVRKVAGGEYVPAWGQGQRANDMLLSAGALAVDAQGVLYVADGSVPRVWRSGPDGIVQVVAGNGAFASQPVAGGLATATPLSPYGVGPIAVATDGSVYFAAIESIWQVRPDGILALAAGCAAPPCYPQGQDNVPAQSVYVAPRTNLLVDRQGGLIFADRFHVQRVAGGVLTNLAGSGVDLGTYAATGDGGSAHAATLGWPARLALMPSGDLLVGDQRDLEETFTLRYLRRVRPALPGVALGAIVIPSADASQIYVFSPTGRHLETRAALTGALLWTFAYDAQGLLVATSDGAGMTTRLERDSAGNPTAVIGPYGQRTTLDVDADGFLARVTDPALDQITLGYDARGLLTSLTRPTGGTHVYAYDDFGRLASDTSPTGALQTLVRSETSMADSESSSFTVTLTTSEGRTASFAETRAADGTLERRTSTPSGALSIDTRDDAILTTVNDDGSVLARAQGPDPRFGLMSPLTTAITLTTPGGLVSTLTRARTAELSDPDDPLSVTVLTDSVSAGDATWTSHWDAAASTLTHTTPEGRRSVTTLDVHGRPIHIAPAGLLPADLTWDAQGRLARWAMGDRSIDVAYGPDGLASAFTDALGGALALVRDAVGRVVAVSRAGTAIVTVAFDANGNPITFTPPGRPSHATTYAADDRVLSRLPPLLPGVDATLGYRYSPDRDLATIESQAGRVDFERDDGGRLARVTTPEGATVYGYADATERIATITAADGGLARYGYDGPLVTSTAWQGEVSGEVRFAYRDDFAIDHITVVGAGATSFGYDRDGLVVSAGPLTLTRHPDHGLVATSSAGVVTTQTTHDGYGSPQTFAAFVDDAPLYASVLTFDRVGRIEARDETFAGASHHVSYGYDALGRLSSVATTEGGETNVATYGYDLNGNRDDGSYDAQDRMLTRLADAYRYDPDGSLVTRADASGTTTFDYDSFGHLVSVILSDGRRIDYVNDGLGRRIGKRIDGVLAAGWLYLDDKRLAAELDGAGAVVRRFVYAEDAEVPDLVVEGERTLRVISDPLGSPRAFVDIASGEIVQRNDYDAWGQMTCTPRCALPHGFAAGHYDADTGLVRFGRRDYDPRAGRFTAKDPLGLGGGDANLYGYVFEDPVNRVDRDGLRADFVLFKKSEAKIGKYIDEPSKYVIAGHGDANKGIHNQQGKNDQWLSMAELAAKIAKDWAAHGKRDVLLISCSTGAGGKASQAQQLADKLGVKVTAPTDYLRGDPQSGEVYHDMVEWREFSPGDKSGGAPVLPPKGLTLE